MGWSIQDDTTYNSYFKGIIVESSGNDGTDIYPVDIVIVDGVTPTGSDAGIAIINDQDSVVAKGELTITEDSFIYFVITMDETELNPDDWTLNTPTIKASASYEAPADGTYRREIGRIIDGNWTQTSYGVIEGDMAYECGTVGGSSPSEGSP